ncbi:MAG: kelch repeat-containing protein [candidate division WOR-3 bacterium]
MKKLLVLVIGFAYLVASPLSLFRPSDKKGLDIPLRAKPIYNKRVKGSSNYQILQTWTTIFSEDFESGTMPTGWTVTNGNNDGYSWTVGVSNDPFYPPNYGTNYLYYSDDDAGSSAPPGDEILTTSSYYIRKIANLRFIYAYDFEEFAGQPYEYGEIHARFFSGGTWSPWNMLVQYYQDTGPKWDTLDLTSFLPADSVQLRFIYSDPSGQWGWGFYLDNFLLEGILELNVLFVDDDQGLTYESYFVNSLSFLNVDHDTFVVPAGANNGPDSLYMSNYDIVIWNTGDDWTYTLTAQDTVEIKKYLNAGGRLWLSSQDVLYNLGTSVSWMHITGFTNDIGCQYATGLGPVMQGFSFATNGNAMTDFADAINPDPSAYPEVVNQDNYINSLSYSGTYKLFFNTFAFENIADPYDRHEFARRVLRFFGYILPKRDVGVSSVYPTGLMQIGDTVQISATFNNFGTLFPENFAVHVEVRDPLNNVILTKDSIITGFQPLAKDTIWAGSVILSLEGIYTIKAYTTSNFDEDATNDTVIGQIYASPWGSWTIYPSPSVNYDRLTHATVYDYDNDRIYMIGGTPNGQAGSNVSYNYRFDPLNNTWETNLAPMPTPRGWIQGVYYNGFIYVAGGYSNSQTALSVFEAYDIQNNAWVNLPALPSPRLAYGAVAWNGSVYILGGLDASFNATNTVLRYDISNNAWTSATSLPLNFFMGGVTHIKDTIYIVGGYTGTGAWTNLYRGIIDQNNPDLITWQDLGPLPYPNMNNAAVSLPGSIIMIGGFVNAATVTDSVWEYKIQSGTWGPIPNYVVPVVRNHFAVGRKARGGTGDRIYVVAGDAYGDWDPPNNYYYYLERPAAISVSEKGEKVNKPYLFVKSNLSNGSFVINFLLTEDKDVDIGLYNILGQRVATIFKGTKSKGEYTINFNKKDLKSGIYFIKMETGDRIPVQRIVKIK